MIIGIDASNIRLGGGLHHLVELMREADPIQHDFRKIVVWGGESTLDKIDDRAWLMKVHLPELDRGILRRTMWQRLELTRLARIAGCNVLFIPGGSYYGNFHPIVTMSQNLLPFEWTEIRRYGWSKSTLRLLLLRWIQSRTLRMSEGVIFLTHYAQLATNKVVNLIDKKMALVGHGVNQRFRVEPRIQHGIDKFSDGNTFRILYVSTVDVYKHQWCVVEAVEILRGRGFPVSLDLVGHAYGPALERLNNVLEEIDPNGKFIHYAGALPYETLHKMYAQANLFVFASSCETFGQIVTEAMSAGLPIACSKLSAMPELLGQAAVYFNPESPDSIAFAIQQLIDSKALRMEKATEAFEKVQKYTWKRCADETFSFLNSIATEYKNRSAL